MPTPFDVPFDASDDPLTLVVATGTPYGLVLTGGNATGSGTGAAVSAIGDVDGDGFEDFAVHRPGQEPTLTLPTSYLKQSEPYRWAAATPGSARDPWMSTSSRRRFGRTHLGRLR